MYEYRAIIENKVGILYGIICVRSLYCVLRVIQLQYNIAIKPGENKGLHSIIVKAFKLKDSRTNGILSLELTSFNDNPISHDSDNDTTGRSRALGKILIDADADTPICKWNGSSAISMDEKIYGLLAI